VSLRAKKKLKRVPATPMIAVTSMMDMFTIILVFLLNFLDPRQDVTADVALPTATSTEAVEEGPTLTVTPEAVRFGGADVFRLDRVDGAVVLPADLPREGRLIVPLRDRLQEGAALLVTAAGEKPPDQLLLRVACDRGVPFSVLGDVLYTASQAGFDQFRFVVIREAG
jgi:biopolymer transport protein ExbD